MSSSAQADSPMTLVPCRRVQTLSTLSAWVSIWTTLLLCCVWMICTLRLSRSRTSRRFRASISAELLAELLARTERPSTPLKTQAKLVSYSQIQRFTF
ncbi:hypothetical protein E4T44_15326 [Aureobasidium sp. EXF-8845]|nr:hypothetical protein E4T44_15326 [Aureobasidium sp. EXF-8845]